MIAFLVFKIYEFNLFYPCTWYLFAIFNFRQIKKRLYIEEWKIKLFNLKWQNQNQIWLKLHESKEHLFSEFQYKIITFWIVQQNRLNFRVDMESTIIGFCPIKVILFQSFRVF